MSDDAPLSLPDTRQPPRRLGFNQKALVVALPLLVVLPAPLSGLVMLLTLTGSPK